MEHIYVAEVEEKIRAIVYDHLKDLNDLSDLAQIELDWIVSKYIEEFNNIKEKL